MRDWWFGVYTDERDDPDVELIPIGWRKAEQYGITGPFPQPGPLALPSPHPPPVEEDDVPQYQDLGQYQFITSGDTTGLNVGNLTSTLDTSSIKMAKFEMYRLVIGVSAVPSIADIPVVVQSTRNQITVDATSLTLTFSNATRVGNTIVVCIGEGASSDAVSGVTLGGSADNFGVVSAATASSRGRPDIEYMG